jgi:hypothetical protein
MMRLAAACRALGFSPERGTKAGSHRLHSYEDEPAAKAWILRRLQGAWLFRPKGALKRVAAACAAMKNDAPLGRLPGAWLFRLKGALKRVAAACAAMKMSLQPKPGFCAAYRAQNPGPLK